MKTKALLAQTNIVWGAPPLANVQSGFTAQQDKVFKLIHEDLDLILEIPI